MIVAAEETTTTTEETATATEEIEDLNEPAETAESVDVDLEDLNEPAETDTEPPAKQAESEVRRTRALAAIARRNQQLRQKEIDLGGRIAAYEAKVAADAREIEQLRRENVHAKKLFDPSADPEEALRGLGVDPAKGLWDLNSRIMGKGTPEEIQRAKDMRLDALEKQIAEQRQAEQQRGVAAEQAMHERNAESAFEAIVAKEAQKFSAVANLAPEERRERLWHLANRVMRATGKPPTSLEQLAEGIEYELRAEYDRLSNIVVKRTEGSTGDGPQGVKPGKPKLSAVIADKRSTAPLASSSSDDDDGEEEDRKWFAGQLAETRAQQRKARETA